MADNTVDKTLKGAGAGAAVGTAVGGPAGAVVGALVGGAASFIGALFSAGDAKKDRQAANKMQQAQIDFDQQRVDDFQATYGSIADNLSNYYNSLSPDYYEAQGLEAFEVEQTIAKENIAEEFARRGIQDSGIAAATEIGFEQQRATTRSKIRTEAPIAAAREKGGFLQIGLGTDPSQSLANTLSSRASRAELRAQGSEADTASAIAGAVESIGSGISDYVRSTKQPDFTYDPNQLQEDVTTGGR